MRTKILFIFLIMLNVTFVSAQSSYYYYKGKRVPLQENYNKAGVVVPAGTLLSIPPSVRITKNIQDALYNIVVYEYASSFVTGSGGGLRATLKSTLSHSALVMPCYTNSAGRELAVTPYLNIKLKKETDQNLLTRMVSIYKLSNLKQNKFMPLWYSATITSDSPGTTVEVANGIYETGLFAAALPDFSFDALECSYDPDFSKQWGLYNSTYADIDISICSAWNYATGRGIKIAIVDQGIDMTHPDLTPNVYALSYDTETGKSPSVVYASHGTHCAGIAAAARNNGIKIAGVAPDAKLMSVSNTLSGSEMTRKLADGINWAWQNGADIISCSWWSSQSDILEDAIDAALTRGRAGKGAIFIKSAGNQRGDSITYPGNYRPEVLTVGSIDSNGHRSQSASVGSQMDVVAPGANIWSTLPNNGAGYKSGTSMAAPHAAGLAALILERNPSLSGQQVRNIIERNTKKVGHLGYTARKANGTWNREYGYGLINAYEAVKNTPRR